MLGENTRHESDDFRAHETPSHIAIAIRPTSASEIRYAVIGSSLVELGVRHDRKGAAIISGANPYPSKPNGAACGHGLRAMPRADAFRGTPANAKKGS